MKTLKQIVLFFGVVVFWMLAIAWGLVAFTSPIWFHQVVIPLVPEANTGGAIFLLIVTWVIVAALLFALRVELGEASDE